MIKYKCLKKYNKKQHIEMFFNKQNLIVSCFVYTGVA